LYRIIDYSNNFKKLITVEKKYNSFSGRRTMELNENIYVLLNNNNENIFKKLF